MLHQLTIRFDGKVRDGNEPNVVSMARAAIIDACVKSKLFDERELSLVNFRPKPDDKGRYPLPTVLYAQPVKNTDRIEIFSFDLPLLRKMASAVDEVRIGKRKLKANAKRIYENVPFLPRPLGEKRIYTTATPILFFNTPGTVSRFFTLEKIHGPKKMAELLKKEFSDLMRTMIRAQIAPRLGKIPEELSWVDSIDVEAIDVSYRWGKYHEDAPPAPRLVAKFASDWELPIFVGHGTGKGYGRLLKKRER